MATPFVDVFALLEGEFGGSGVKEADEVKKNQKVSAHCMKSSVFHGMALRNGLLRWCMAPNFLQPSAQQPPRRFDRPSLSSRRRKRRLSNSRSQSRFPMGNA